MKILITGASSFTGFWFAGELARAGHDVTATFTAKSSSDYEGIRGERVAQLISLLDARFGCRFGDEAFQKLVHQHSFDVLCQHAADVTDYKSPDFDVQRAVAGNSHNLRSVLHQFTQAGGQRVVLTGSIFEGGEGVGSQNVPHFSAYGLSKALTAMAFEFYCREANLSLGKFVIPNPFGPYEEPRFTNYLMKTWVAGETAGVNTPDYVRDNIHVSLLAKAYVEFVEQLPASPGFRRINPMGYVETQGAFAQRFAREIGSRLGLDCKLNLAKQTEFSEPKVRLNMDLPDCEKLHWDEAQAWDELANYFSFRFGLS